MGYVDPLTSQAREPFRTALAGMLNEANGKVTIGNLYRDKALQAQMRVKNGCPDVYDSPASSCRVPTARPGESNHEDRSAADLEGDLALAHRLAAKYRLHWPVPGENWHVEMIGVNRKSAGGNASGNPDAPAPDPAAPPADDKSGWGVLVDPHTWLRVLYVVGGLFLTVTGALLVLRDTHG